MAFLRVLSCCGDSLEKGTKTLAILSIIGSIFNILRSFLTSITPWVIGEIIACGLVILVNVLVLYAIKKRNPVYLLPCLVYDAICLVICTLAVPVLIGFAIYLGISQPNMTIVIILIALAIFLCFLIVLGYYFFAVTYSYYHELIKEVNGSSSSENDNQDKVENGGHPPTDDPPPYQEKQM